METASLPNQPQHVLIISHEIVGSRMAGPGIRYYHLARVLAREFPVTLAVPAGSDLSSSTDISVLQYDSGADVALQAAIRRARTILLPAISVAQLPALQDCDAAIVIDGYDPFVAETLSLTSEGIAEQQAALTHAYLLGDFFICASERQRDWWLGVLEANGRINIYTYAEDASLRRLIDLVPFGVPATPPQHTRQAIKGVWRGIEEQDRVILWGGGLWQWLDPLTAIRAMAKVWQRRQDVRLIFPGTRHPNPAMSRMLTQTESARALASQFGLLDNGIFFGDWVPYGDWQNVLLESDIALTLHYDTLETRLAFRSRALDYVWAGLPIIAARGDAISELVEQRKIGVTVDCQDVDGVAAAILQLLDTPREVFATQFDKVRQVLTWERVAQPLIRFCRHPRRAPDKVALGERLGNPFYVRESSQLHIQIAQLRTEVTQLQSRAQAFERRRVVRMLNWFRQIGDGLCVSTGFTRK